MVAWAVQTNGHVLYDGSSGLDACVTRAHLPASPTGQVSARAFGWQSIANGGCEAMQLGAIDMVTHHALLSLLVQKKCPVQLAFSEEIW